MRGGDALWKYWLPGFAESAGRARATWWSSAVSKVGPAAIELSRLVSTADLAKIFPLPPSVGRLPFYMEGEPQKV